MKSIAVKTVLFLMLCPLMFSCSSTPQAPTPVFTAAVPTLPATPFPPTSTITPLPIPTDIPGILNPQTGHRYLAVYTQMNWNDARDYCRNMKGDLVTITSEQENQFVYELNPNTWIGLSDAIEEGNWKWVTGEPLEYTNWAEGEPNNCSDCTNVYMEEGEDFAGFKGNAPEKWNDCPIEVSSFVCEWDASK